MQLSKLTEDDHLLIIGTIAAAALFIICDDLLHQFCFVFSFHPILVA